MPKHDDVQTAKEWADEIGLVGNVQLVCGGFPCQDVSVAGKRAGLAGARTGLFWDALSFATHVKAEWIVLENVPGLISSNNGHDFATVIAALRNAGFHYVEWRVFDSQFYGVPQRRRRIFIVGHTGNPSRFPIFIERESRSGDHPQSGEKGQIITTKTEGSSTESSWEPVDDRSIMNCIPAELYHKGSVVNQDVNAGHLLVGNNKVGTDVVGSLLASDYKFPQQQQAHEGKIIIQQNGQHVGY